MMTEYATTTLNQTVGGAEELFTEWISAKGLSSYQIEWTGTVAADAIQVQVTNNNFAISSPSNSTIVWSTKAEVVPDSLPVGSPGNTAQSFSNNGFVAWRLRINVTSGTGNILVRMK